MLYDLAEDPDEYVDLGQSPTHAHERARLYEQLARWSRMTLHRPQFLTRKSRHV